MPGRDRTGPLGEGPLTGRGRGLCTGTRARPAGIRPRFGRAILAGGAGCADPGGVTFADVEGAGFAGGGRRFRNRFCADASPYNAPAARSAPGAQEGAAGLPAQADQSHSTPSTLEQRVGRLEEE